MANLLLGDAHEGVTSFKVWLDDELSTDSKYLRERLRDQSCKQYGCTEVRYLGRMGLGAVQMAFSEEIGARCTSEALDLLVALHKPNCDDLRIALVSRESGTAIKSAGAEYPLAPTGTITAQIVKRELMLSRSSNTGHLVIIDRGSTDQAAYGIGTATEDMTGTHYSKHTYPTAVHEIDAVLLAMRQQVSGALGLALPESS